MKLAGDRFGRKRPGCIGGVAQHTLLTEVHDTLQVPLWVDERELQGNHPHRTPRRLLNRAFDIGHQFAKRPTQTLQLGDRHHTRRAPGSLPPCEALLSAQFDPGTGIHHQQRRVGHMEPTFLLVTEARGSGGVDHHQIPIPVAEPRHGQRTGHAQAVFLITPVEQRGTGLHGPHLPRDPACLKEELSPERSCHSSDAQPAPRWSATSSPLPGWSACPVLRAACSCRGGLHRNTVPRCAAPRQWVVA